MRGRRHCPVSAISPGFASASKSGTLADADSDDVRAGAVIDNITHLVPGRDDLLGALDRSDFDATLLDLRRFDAYRAAHPATRLAAPATFIDRRQSRFMSPPSDPDLLVAVNKALSDCRPRGTHS